MVKMLADAGYATTVFDNLSLGHRDAIVSGEFLEGDLLNRRDLDTLFHQRSFDIVMHFAALCYVGESVVNPLSYYQNNVAGTVNLLEAMMKAGATRFVFSSSCAIYGIPLGTPITEEHTKNPINPYGHTKLTVEHLLLDSAKAYGLHSIALRYFNAAGCDPERRLGERHDPETHLIPLVLEEAQRVLKGGRPEDTALRIFGTDFDTPDGTCIRDYIHVEDLCAAHLAATERLLDGKSQGAEAYNLGNGKGFSVKEVIETCRRVTGVDIRYTPVDRRPGDPPLLVGSSEKARSILAWIPKITSLEKIVETAWHWVNHDGDQ
jgi:UDP-glucose-4-epimerase GalE